MVEFANKVSLVMQEPDSDEEVEMDSYTSVQRGVGVADGVVVKSKAFVKTYDWYFSGVPNLSVFGTTQTLYPFCHDYAGAHNDFTGTLSWIPFRPEWGSGKNEIVGRPDIVVDGVKASIYAWFPKSLEANLAVTNHSMKPVHRVFFELLYLRTPPGFGDDVGRSFIGTEYWRKNLYERCFTLDECWNTFLTKTAITSGVRSIKRWSFTLDRECYHETGRDFDNKAWWQVETGPLVYNGGNRVEGVIGLNEAVWAEVVGQKNFVQSYSGFPDPAYKGFFAPVQKHIDQRKSFWRIDEWVPVKCSINLTPPYTESHPGNLYPADVSTKGCLVLACWSDMEIPPGAVPYTEIPQVEANFRFKFHQK